MKKISFGSMVAEGFRPDLVGLFPSMSAGPSQLNQTLSAESDSKPHLRVATLFL